MHERAESVESICATLTGESDEVTLLTSLMDLEQLACWTEAQRHRLHVQIAGIQPIDFVVGDGKTRIRDFKVDEIAVAMRWSPEWARRQVAISRNLVRHLPRLLTLLEEGKMSSYQAWAAADGINELLVAISDPEHIEDAVDCYSDLLETQIETATGGLFRRAVRRAVAEIAPQSAEDRHQTAAAKRHVRVTMAQDGMSIISAYLPDIDAHRVMTAIRATAETAPCLAGSSNQNQADALVGLITGSLTEDGNWVPPQTEVQLIMPYDLLLNKSTKPVEIVGSEGFVLPAVAMELIGEARIRRILTDPVSGQVMDIGRTSYRPTAAIRDLVVTRDQVCRFPTCHQASNKLDLDHTHPWEEGGSTSVDNLVSLCRRHHNYKTGLKWNYQLQADGNVRWKSRIGLEWLDPARLPGG